MEAPNVNTPSNAPSGNFYPQDFDLESVDIITSAGQTLKLKNLVTEMSFFEDIYTFAVSGYVILRDAVGLIEKLRLSGNEFLQLTYGKAKSQNKSAKNSRKYRVYKIGNRRPVGNFSSEFFTLYFCSETLMLSEQIKISKSYSGKKIAVSNLAGDGIINDILVNQLKVNEDGIVKIEETYGTYDFIVPRLKPLEAISWLSTYARPQSSKLGADMLFFETNDGFNYRSLQSLYADTPYNTYKYQPKNILSNQDEGGFADATVSVLEVEHVKTFDVLNETSSGTYANRLISIDPITRSYKVTDYSYEDDYLNNQNKPNLLNNNSTFSPGKNKLGLTQTSAYESLVKVVIGNSNQNSADYIKERTGSVAKDIYIETFVPFRTSQISLANYTVLKLLVPGDSGITAGRTVNFNMYSLAVDSNNNKKLDEYFSGKYLVTAVRHIMQPTGVYQMILEVAKESAKMAFSSPNSMSAQEQRVINEAY